MERMHLKNGGSIGYTVIEDEDGPRTRLSVLAGDIPATVTLTSEEEEDLVYLIETGSVRLRCSKCSCVQERACVRVEGEQVVEVCGWAELEPVPICTACGEGAASTWKHPAEQEAEFEQNFAMTTDDAVEAA